MASREMWIKKNCKLERHAKLLGFRYFSWHCTSYCLYIHFNIILILLLGLFIIYAGRNRVCTIESIEFIENGQLKQTNKQHKKKRGKRKLKYAKIYVGHVQLTWFSSILSTLTGEYWR